jgi:hypothetical protein
MPQWRGSDPRDIYSAAPGDPYAQGRGGNYARAPGAVDDGYADGGYAPPLAPQRAQPPRGAQSPDYSQGVTEPSFDSFGQTLGRVAQSPRTAPPARAAAPIAQRQPPRSDPQQVPQYAAPPYPGYADQQSADPSGYHLGNYAALQQPYGGQHDQGYPPYGDPAQQGYGAPPYGYQHPGGDSPPEQAEDDYEYEYEEEPRRSRRWLIVAALVGSIGVGGGLAYGYKAMIGDTRGRTQVVKASTNPTKTPPEERGGKRFANTDNKFMNRLQPDGASPPGAVDSAGVRRVQTVTVGKDLTADSPRTASQSAAGGGVPGMILVDRDSMPPPPAPQGGPSAAPSLPMMAGAPPPGAVDRLPPPSPPPRVAARTEPPPVRTPPVRVAAPRPEPPEAAPPQTGAAAAKARPTRDGYVAVLGYQKSQLDAMKMMADLQQQYSVLQGKQMEVLASDQSSRGLGTIYRVVVGPPGGISTARGVCTELTQAGMPASRCYTIVPR